MLQIETMQANLVGNALRAPRIMTGIAARVVSSQAACTRIRLRLYVLFKSLKKQRKKKGRKFISACLSDYLFVSLFT